MISGINPFKKATMNGKSRRQVLMMITDEDVEILSGFSYNAADLLEGLLRRNPRERLTVEQIKRHPFFETIDWDLLYERKIDPPYQPNTMGETDIANIDEDFTNEAP